MYKAIHALKTIGKSAHTKVKDEKGNYIFDENH